MFFATSGGFVLRLNLSELGNISCLCDRDRLIFGLVLRRINRAEELSLTSLFLKLPLSLSEKRRAMAAHGPFVGKCFVKFGSFLQLFEVFFLAFSLCLCSALLLLTVGSLLWIIVLCLMVVSLHWLTESFIRSCSCCYSGVVNVMCCVTSMLALHVVGILSF